MSDPSIDDEISGAEKIWSMIEKIGQLLTNAEGELRQTLEQMMAQVRKAAKLEAQGKPFTLPDLKLLQLV